MMQVEHDDAMRFIAHRGTEGTEGLRCFVVGCQWKLPATRHSPPITFEFGFHPNDPHLYHFVNPVNPV